MASMANTLKNNLPEVFLWAYSSVTMERFRWTTCKITEFLGRNLPNFYGFFLLLAKLLFSLV